MDERRTGGDRRYHDRRRRLELPALAGAIFTVMLALLALVVFNLFKDHGSWRAWLIFLAVLYVFLSCADTIANEGRVQERVGRWIRSLW